MRHLTLATALCLSCIATAQNAVFISGLEQEEYYPTDTISLPVGITTTYDAIIPAESTAPNDSTENVPLSLLDSILQLPPVEIRELREILTALPDTMPELPYNSLVGPWVFSGYRTIKDTSFQDLIDTTGFKTRHYVTPWEDTPYTPGWLHDALTQSRISQDYMYQTMVYTPETLQYTYWGLPVPPRLPEDDVTLGTYIRNLNLPEVSTKDAIIPDIEFNKKHWLHKFNTGLQFSQAYVSKNWYQGGNNYLSLLYNFYWDVQLNPSYHPDQIFQSTVSCKLGVNSLEQSSVGKKYSLSEDQFQYNVKYGFKAFRKWFYTITGQLKTQFFNNYKPNTDIRSASLLSPGDLNLGIGMTYSKVNAKKTFNLTASIAPLSYNMKICIDKNIDVTQFNIKPGHKTHSEYGSSAEMNMTWQARSNISMRTRVFAFTDYTYFQGNIETTWDFAINKFLSTQIYANLRYDSSSDYNASKWHHWMLKEILSFGLSYTFSTK